MGSFNGRCMFSGITINEGDDAMIVFLARNPMNDGDNSIIYANHDWQPISMPIAGKYNDYGRLEDVDEAQPAARHFLKVFNEWVAGGEIGYTESTKTYYPAEAAIPVVAPKDISELQSLIQDNRICHYGSSFGYAMFLPNWWEKMVEIGKNAMANHTFYSTSTEKTMIADTIKSADKWIKWAKAMRAEMDSPPPMRSSKLREEWIREKSFHFREAIMDGSEGRPFLNYVGGFDRPLLKVSILHHFRDLLPTIPDYWPHIRDSIAQAIVIEHGMRAIGLMWLPFKYGDQGYDPGTATALYAKELAKAAKEKKRWYKRMTSE